jgi:hypothetical protein
VNYTPPGLALWSRLPFEERLQRLARCGYLYASTNGCPPNMKTRGSNFWCVATASYCPTQSWNNERDGPG